MTPLHNRDDKSGLQQWLNIRKAAGLQIHPNSGTRLGLGLQDESLRTAKGSTRGIEQIGREWFARAPGSEFWVSFDVNARACTMFLNLRVECADKISTLSAFQLKPGCRARLSRGLIRKDHLDCSSCSEQSTPVTCA